MQSKVNQIGEKAVAKGNNQPSQSQNQSQSQSNTQQVTQPPAPTQRPQHGPPGPSFFPHSHYPGRGHRPGPPPQRFAGYGPPHTHPHPPHPLRQPFAAPGQELMLNRDDRDARFDRSAMPTQSNTAPFQRPRASSYVHYAQQLQPPSYPSGGVPPPPPPQHVVHASHPDGRFDSHPPPQRPGSPSQRPPPYGSPYTIARSQSWANADRTYHNGGPYTSAQRNSSEGRLDGETQNDEIAPFGMLGSNGPPPQQQQQPLQPLQLMQKPYTYHQPPQTHSSVLPRAVDADAMAYKAVEGRDGATSPSQIDSNRREDVSIMGCTCKKTKCLKLYCVCFGASVMCGVSCRCLICHNTPVHEQARKDAIRSILARNPSAFDTKFKKTPEARAIHQPADKAIAHRLGCKCRKSFCTKKYCECYNAGVKCSGSCRCVGCKNMPPGGFGSDQGDSAIAPRSFPTDVNRVNSVAETVATLPPNSEHKMRDAATHLAFLKHSSPARPVKEPAFGARPISASIPSLTDSSSGTMSSSPDDDHTKNASMPPSTAAIGVDSLLMAAYAMTELQEVSEPPMTPKKIKSSVPFKSPKRKSHPTPLEHQFDDADDVECSEESDDTEEDRMDTKGARLMTPNDMRQVKRTRVGTVERKPPKTGELPATLDTTPRLEKPPSDSEEEEGDLSPDNSTQPSPEESIQATSAMTPQTTKKSSSVVGGLTPVTARCIDFQHMGMAEAADMDEKKEEDMATA